MHRRNLFVIACLVSITAVARGIDTPVLAIIDFTGSVVSKKESTLLVDLLGHNLEESGRCKVVGRVERNRLLKGFEDASFSTFDTRRYIEAGKRLLVDFIVGGNIEQDKGGCLFSIYVFDVVFSRPVAILSYVHKTMDDAIEASRDISRDILGRVSGIDHGEPYSTRLLESLSPVSVKERILFILAPGPLDKSGARANELLDLIVQKLVKSNRFIPYVAEEKIDASGIARFGNTTLLDFWNCHYCAILREKDGGYTFDVYDAKGEPGLEHAIRSPFDPEAESGDIAREVEEKLPLLPIKVVAREMENNIVLEEKLADLLFEERLLSRAFSVSVYQNLLKSAYTYTYGPTLDIFSIECDGFWFYGGMIGLGLGYGLSLNYPGTMDEALRAHPIIWQHEFRLIPLAFRTGGAVGLMLKLVSSINLQNVCRVFAASQSSVVCTDERLLCFAKIGINVGLLFNLDERFSLFCNGLTFNYAIPVFGQIDYDTPEYKALLPFSIDVGFLGFTYRF